MYRNGFLTEGERSLLARAAAWSDGHFKSARDAGVVRGGHDFDHVQRVAGLTAQICEGERFEPFLPILAALVADVGRASTDSRAGTWQHGKLSCELATELFSALKMQGGLSGDQLRLVTNAIEDHPKRNGEIRSTYVAVALQDGDRVSTISPSGALRAAQHRWNLPLNGYQTVSTAEADLKTLGQDFDRIVEWYNMLHTQTAKEIARPRLAQLKEIMRMTKEELDANQQAFLDLRISW